MQQPQSSSTLNNYISGAQNNQDSSRLNHEQSSSCVQCQHIKIEKQSASDSDSGSSSGDDGQLVQPLHRHIIEHSRQIQATITHLQQEIQKLKSANSSKDSLIEQLKIQLKKVKFNSKISHSMQEDVKEAEFLRRQKQIQNIRKEIYENSQNLMNSKMINSPLNPIHELNDQNSINEELRRRLKKVEVMFEDKSRGHGNVEIDHKGKNKKISNPKKVQVRQDSESSEDSSDNQEHHKQQRCPSYDHKKQQNHKNSSKNQRAPLTANNKHRSSKQVPQSQNDMDSKESSIEYELNQHFEKITRLEKHIQFCEDQMLWMTNFIIAFLKRSEKLMGNFNQPVLKQHWNIKKKTKIAWRYTKHILGYLIP